MKPPTFEKLHQFNIDQRANACWCLCSESSRHVGPAVEPTYNPQPPSDAVAKSHVTFADMKKQEWKKEAGSSCTDGCSVSDDLDLMCVWCISK